MIFINDPEDIKFILNHPEALHKGKQQIKAVKPICGDGLLLAHRKLNLKKEKMTRNFFVNC